MDRASSPLPPRRSRRRWLQFGLSHLLVATMLVAVLLTWQRQRISQWVDSLWAGPAENDARDAKQLSVELLRRLHQQFPKARIVVRPLGKDVWLGGELDEDDMPAIVHIEEIAKDYFADVVNHITIRYARTKGDPRSVVTDFLEFKRQARHAEADKLLSAKASAVIQRTGFRVVDAVAANSLRHEFTRPVDLEVEATCWSQRRAPTSSRPGGS